MARQSAVFFRDVLDWIGRRRWSIQQWSQLTVIDTLFVLGQTLTADANAHAGLFVRSSREEW